MNNMSFTPTEENARKLETWNKAFGHDLPSCSLYHGNGDPKFWMDLCAVNCYSQWFAGLSCPLSQASLNWKRREVTMRKQYEVAREKILRYNFIVVSEMLRYPEYVAAVERIFGVPGAGNQDVHPWCEVENHYANKRIPLIVKNETVEKLTLLNEIDTALYHEVRDCLYKKDYNFAAWDATRFETNKELQLDHEAWEHKNPGRYYMKPSRGWRSKFNTNNSNVEDSSSDEEESDVVGSPSCKPHFNLALPDGNWTNVTKFKRLYFYHAQNAGVSRWCLTLSSLLCGVITRMIVICGLGYKSEAVLHKGR